ncbi:MAG: hypothetical protein IAE64_04030 [Flavobacteriales bacterium]|nr:MAG: hypothetical protein F9K28_02755 [Bacteroidota bacterium]MBE2265401.1 hypothetical protein [Flavobacteriales bacterium]MBW7853623.1 hypothetical protein [Candidatus Kapabacteria bacterium]MCC6332143.1 hypothetical protein [Ignavibacteria bacterium]MBZ0193898.1 hypothetical protein [Candidatus Kapabacteria bacterium]
MINAATIVPCTRAGHRMAVLLAVLVMSTAGVSAQIFQTSIDDNLEYPLDTLIRNHEWWLGFGSSAFYAVNFGTLTVDLAGGTSPGSPTYRVTPSGGTGYGMGVGPALEYRPRFSQLGYMLAALVEWRHASAETTVPIAYDNFAYNAVYESHSTVVYAGLGLSVKAQLGVTGMFAMAGLTADVPVAVTSSYLWQHELWNGELPSNLPGAPQTSIKWKTNVNYMPRLGLQVGFGHDFMVGMFGNRNQLLSPYVVLQGATPTVSEPSAWNNISIRLGAVWRTGL